MTTTQIKPYTLAIVGGGISGLVLALGLIKHKIPVTIYESATQFGEIGAGVGFAPHFVDIMERISPDIKQGFLRINKNVKTNPPKWFDIRISDRRKADKNGVVHIKNGKEIKLDELVFWIPAREGEGGGVHRAHFLDELVKLLPEGITKFQKRLVNVTEAVDGSGDAVLQFADGTVAQHTAVIGCDGIKSRTRQLVLGEEEGKPRFSGKYAYRGLLPMNKAQEIMGETMPLSSQMFCGYKGHVLTFPIANGSIMNVVAFSSTEEWKSSDWVVQTSREEILEDYKEWTQIVRDIMSNLKNPDIWALFNHAPAETFLQTKPMICLLGDAAHATTPHQGSGAGMCIEDAYILSELLADVETAGGLEKAFRAYEAVRRPRVLELVETSRQAASLWEMEGPEGNDIDAFERNACSRMNWIWDHDISTDLERAREMMNE